MHRITPACAGNTFRDSFYIGSLKDHPRMCGKYHFFSSFLFSLQGSPPHVREIHIYFLHIFLYTRITPACAGNTFSLFVYICFLEDHPRMCGKYTKRSIYDATCNLRIPFFHSLLNFQFIS